MAERREGPPKAAIGCFMAPIGGACGAMIAVLVSKMVAFFMKAPSCPDIPTCDWYVYAGIGAVIGGLTLPALVLRRLMQGPKTDNSQRG